MPKEGKDTSITAKSGTDREPNSDTLSVILLDTDASTISAPNSQQFIVLCNDKNSKTHSSLANHI